MQANEFEKEVKERMDELQLYPSAGVWPEVEKRIRKEKKRRWVIFWWLLPLLLAGGAGTWYLLNNKNRKDIAQQETSLTVPENKKENNISKPNPVVSDTPAIAVPYNKQPNEFKTIKPEDNVNTIAAARPGTVTKTEMVITQRGAKRRSAGTNQPVPDVAQGNETQTLPVSPLSAADKPAIAANRLPQQTDKVNDNRVAVKTPVDNVKPDDSVVTAVAPAKEKITEPGTVVTAGQLQDKKKNKWETGISFTAGSFSRVDGNFAGLAKSFDVNSSFNNSGSFIAQPPGQLAGGVHLQVGFYAKKNIGKKTAFSTGLLVSANSVIQQVGVYYPVNTVGLGSSPRFASGYYSGGSVTAVANRYTLVSVPFLLHWQLNKGKKVPLAWENGFSASVIPVYKTFVFDSGPENLLS